MTSLSSEPNMRSVELRKLILVLVALIVVTNGFAVFLNWFLLMQIQSGKTLFSMGPIPNGLYYEAVLPLFIFLELLVVIWLYRPVVPTAPRDHNLLKMAFAGVGSGLGLVILFMPFLLRAKPETWLVSLILYYRKSSFTYVAAALVLVLLPIAGELVFRGVILRTLLEYVSPIYALVVTIVGFAFIWPLIFRGYVWAVGLGIVTSLLYYRFRLLLPTIIANITFTIALVAFLMFRDILHG